MEALSEGQVLIVLSFVAEKFGLQAMEILASRRIQCAQGEGVYGGPNTSWHTEAPRYQQR